MKKIGIITVQKAPENYGACLQCYADAPGFFHGSVFSFLFSKKLLTVCTNRKVSERLTTLFGTFSLSTNLIDVEKFIMLGNLDLAHYSIAKSERIKTERMLKVHE